MFCHNLDHDLILILLVRVTLSLSIEGLDETWACRGLEDLAWSGRSDLDEGIELRVLTGWENWRWRGKSGEIGCLFELVSGAALCSSLFESLRGLTQSKECGGRLGKDGRKSSTEAECGVTRSK
jgi:hypothetical protein